MKKTLCIILTILLLCLSACSGSSKSAVQDKPSESSEKTEEKQKEPEKPVEKKAAYVISDETVIDDENCTMRITKAEENSLSVTFKVFLENKTDKNLTFSIMDAAVNGYMNDPFWAEAVAAGKKSNSTFSFYKSSLSDCNIETIDKLEMKIRVYDSDDWMADPYIEDTFIVYPTGLSEDQVVIPERWKGNSEMSCVENDRYSFVILGTYIDDIWGYTVVAYLENKTDHEMMFSWEDVSVNGYMIDPFWASSVTPGNRSLESINFSKSGFEENEIETVEEIEFSLNIHDNEDWMNGERYNEVFTYTPAQ